MRLDLDDTNPIHRIPKLETLLAAAPPQVTTTAQTSAGSMAGETGGGSENYASYSPC